MADRDKDGVPDEEQLTIEEIEAVDRHFGMGILEVSANEDYRAKDVGITAHDDFDPTEYEYVGTPRPVVIRHKKTGKRFQLNYNRFVEKKVIEFREGHSIEGGVMGARAASISNGAFAKLGSFGSFVTAILGAGGSVPALLLNAGVDLLRTRLKGKRASALVDQLLGKGLGVLLALSLLGGQALAGDVLVLDHDVLASQVETQEPNARIDYAPERVEFRTRRSVLVGWINAVLKARFERHGDRVQLVAQSLHAGPLGEQRGKRFLEAKARLLKLVDVKTTARFVEIHDGRLIHRYPVIEGDTDPVEEDKSAFGLPRQVPRHITRPARMPEQPEG